MLCLLAAHRSGYRVSADTPPRAIAMKKGPPGGAVVLAAPLLLYATRQNPLFRLSGDGFVPSPWGGSPAPRGGLEHRHADRGCAEPVGLARSGRPEDQQRLWLPERLAFLSSNPDSRPTVRDVVDLFSVL